MRGVSSRHSCAGWEEWLWESFYFRWHSRLRCLGLLPPRRRPTSCAKLSERARLVTVAPTLSPMPNGKPLSGASGTAESASSAIAFRRPDYWLSGRWTNADAEIQGRRKENLCPRQYAHCCLRAGRQERSEAWRKSLHRRGQATRWNVARSRMAGRPGWCNAAYVIAARASAMTLE